MNVLWASISSTFLFYYLFIFSNKLNLNVQISVKGVVRGAYVCASACARVCVSVWVRYTVCMEACTHANPGHMSTLLPCVCSCVLSELSSQHWRTLRSDVPFTVYIVYTVCGVLEVIQALGRLGPSQTSLISMRIPTRQNYRHSRWRPMTIWERATGCCLPIPWGSCPITRNMHPLPHLPSALSCQSQCMKLVYSVIHARDRAPWQIFLHDAH